MSLANWLVLIIPMAFIMGMGFYSRRYVVGVSDFLSAGRLCGRWVISMGDIANALAIITLVAYVEVHYATGFALVFWQKISGLIAVVFSLTGFMTYRFRQTKAMSFGQFLEMRYSRKFRIFAATLRSLSEMLANMIMPAIAARFFIYFLGFPHEVSIFGFQVKTFIIVVFVVLTLAISLILCGGTLALVITDCLQGMICYPLMALFVIFILVKFNWNEQIVPVMSERVGGESFLSPYDISELRDFNVFYIIVGLLSTTLNRG
ncbi:MAG: sodium:panthothenate symporter, partial [Lentisphaeria bacterium]|nr:sodium:panthothenate symporter [Lentisphaeria bacterium]